jgi:hypothetical protein
VNADPIPSISPSSSTSGRHPLGTVYLFHFDQRYEHAGHYTGWLRTWTIGWQSIKPAAVPA